MVANAAIVAAGTPSGGISVYNRGPSSTDLVIDLNGYYAAPTDLNNNTAIELGTLTSNTYGSNNTAVGAAALGANTSGGANVAAGAGALGSNLNGNDSTALGYYALQSNTSGYDTPDFQETCCKSGLRPHRVTTADEAAIPATELARMLAELRKKRDQVIEIMTTLGRLTAEQESSARKFK